LRGRAGYFEINVAVEAGEGSEVKREDDSDRRITLPSAFQSRGSIDTNHSSLVDDGFAAYVLMAVDEQSRLRAFNVTVECIEAEVGFVIPVMNMTRRIVSDKNINGWERGHQMIHFFLLVKIVPTGLVSPRAAKTAETYPENRVQVEMKVNNRREEVAASVMVSLYCQDA